MEQLRNRKLSGYKFLRQHSFVYKADDKGLNADFYCYAKKAVVELDGPIHEETVEYDAFRNEEMNFLGISVLRLKNEELNDMNAALEKILNFLNHL